MFHRPSSGTTSANSSLAELENAFKTFKLDARLSKIKEFHDEAADLDVELVYTIQGIVGREDEVLSSHFLHLARYSCISPSHPFASTPRK